MQKLGHVSPPAGFYLVALLSALIYGFSSLPLFSTSRNGDPKMTSLRRSKSAVFQTQSTIMAKAFRQKEAKANVSIAL